MVCALMVRALARASGDRVVRMAARATLGLSAGDAANESTAVGMTAV